MENAACYLPVGPDGEVDARLAAEENHPPELLTEIARDGGLGLEFYDTGVQIMRLKVSHALAPEEAVRRGNAYIRTALRNVSASAAARFVE